MGKIKTCDHTLPNGIVSRQAIWTSIFSIVQQSTANGDDTSAALFQLANVENDEKRKDAVNGARNLVVNTATDLAEIMEKSTSATKNTVGEKTNKASSTGSAMI